MGKGVSGGGVEGNEGGWVVGVEQGGERGVRGREVLIEVTADDEIVGGCGVVLKNVG